VIRVLVVEDDPLAAQAHRTYVERVAGFKVCGVVHSGRDALRFVREHGVDLVLLDFHLPDLHGLDVARAIRGAGAPIDVMAVTSVRDLAAIRSAVSQGVVLYILKPFSFAALRGKLERYAQYRSQVEGAGAAGTQAEVDRALAALRGVDRGALPSGLIDETLSAVAAAVRAAETDAASCGSSGVPAGVSAAEVAASCGMSRITARRYLEHLAETGVALRRPRYGGPGRPEIEYRWNS
jgi:response regulator of citrate/malate metabolism